MDKDDYRFSLSGEKYLEKLHILTYIEDAVTQLLEHKDENPKVNSTKFFSDYFTSVREGNHVLFREYGFIKATPHNRSSFVRTFWKCFRNIGRKGDLLSIREYHSLICLLCSDFPFAPVQKTARIILMDDAMDCLISFTDFLYAFQVQFCFDEFLSKCAEVYKELLQKPQGVNETVVVPTSEESPEPPVHTKNSEIPTNSDGVDAMHYFRSLIPVCEKLEFNAPPLPVLREILSSAERVTFYGFLMAMAKSEKLNDSIGKLPKKSELLEISDQELTSPPIRPSSASKARSRPVSAAVQPRSLSASATNPITNPAVPVTMATSATMVKTTQSMPTNAFTMTTNQAGNRTILTATLSTTNTNNTNTSASINETKAQTLQVTKPSGLASTGSPVPRRLVRSLAPKARRTSGSTVGTDSDEDDDDDDDTDSTN